MDVASTTSLWGPPRRGLTETGTGSGGVTTSPVEPVRSRHTWLGPQGVRRWGKQGGPQGTWPHADHGNDPGQGNAKAGGLALFDRVEHVLHRFPPPPSAR